MADLIKVSNVTKVFGQGEALVHAFGPADLVIQEGDFISFVGPSGCGKSTLMLMIAGLLDISQGQIFVAGEKVVAPQNNVGIMFQDSTLVPWRTVRKNIELQLEMRGLAISDYQDNINSLLQSVDLLDFADYKPYELSGGMQQRAAFCQAMAHKPQTVLLDEPLGKLDAMTREKIRSDLQNLWLKTRNTVVLVTHSIEEAVQLSTKVAVITPRPGKIAKIIDIDLDFPRDYAVKKSSKFSAYNEEIHAIFRGYGVI